MKSIAELLARIYPAAWRERYGEELRGLIEDRTPRLGDLFDVLRGGLKMQLTSRLFLGIALPCALVGVTIAALIALATPKLYSSGTAMVLSSRYSSDAGGQSEQMKPADAESAQRQLVPIIVGVFRDRSAMVSIIQRYNLYPNDRAKMPLDEVIRKMQKAIMISPLSPSRGAEKSPVQPAGATKQTWAAFAVRFNYPDPWTAQKVDGDITGLLLAENLKQAIASPSRPPKTLTVLRGPNLPDKPMGPPLIVKCGVGLLGGLLAGLLLMMTGIGSGPRFAQR